MKRLNIEECVDLYMNSDSTWFFVFALFLLASYLVLYLYYCNDKQARKISSSLLPENNCK